MQTVRVAVSFALQAEHALFSWLGLKGWLCHTGACKEILEALQATFVWVGICGDFLNIKFCCVSDCTTEEQQIGKGYLFNSWGLTEYPQWDISLLLPTSKASHIGCPVVSPRDRNTKATVLIRLVFSPVTPYTPKTHSIHRCSRSNKSLHSILWHSTFHTTVQDYTT